MIAELRSGRAGWHRVVLAIAACLVAIAGNSLAALDDLEVSALFKEGGDLFQEANELSASKPEEARALYEKSAMRFERD